ncbi:MAG TPA: zinc-ribbon domain-containing protein [Candidatus Polarisedimenticolia bacterium]|nr:zinc-ribbon domain-containing protein [Candidatus Polarisedimenticolia bacterium]
MVRAINRLYVLAPEAPAMMVSCPGCNTQYSIDERRVPARGGKLTCPECGMQWKVGGTAKPGRSRSSNATSPTGAASSPAPAAALHASDSSSILQNPVSCPKCGHFFVPAKGTSTGSIPAADTAAGRSAAAGRAPGRVLLIEDQPYFAELTRESLAGTFETTVESSLAAARARLADEAFDLVILDLSLEDGQDGSQLLRLTRERGIPVLVFTARDETELYSGAWDSLKAAGATDILIKGMNVGEELRQKVQALVSSRRS